MKFSYNWLKELSGTKKTAKEIAELFLTHSFEVEGIEDLSKGLDKVVVGEVLSVEKHPDADRLNIAKVDVGKKNGRKLQIVCGAPNLVVGQKVPVALVGAKLPDGDGFFEIKKSKIRGVESSGMICAEDELGLGDDHEGIMVLADNSQSRKDAESGDESVMGQSLAEYLHLDDKILDIDILPNRGHDCLGYNGVARELNALENFEFRILNFDSNSNVLISNDKTGENKQGESKRHIEALNNSKFNQNSIKIQNLNENDLKIEIDTPDCSRYAGVRIKNIQIKPSPIWMQTRLKASGLNPINNVVDITNYVMLETGQPLHAFTASHTALQSQTNAELTRTDADETRIDAGIDKIVVRQAEEGEKIKLLDEQELKLTKDDIVITDGQKPIALAGVMGGLESGIQDNTTEIILEGANFNSSSIRFTARRYNLQTDAAYRFERDIDPNFVDIALGRAVELIKELAGGKVVAMNDIYPEPVKPWTIELDADYVRSLLGVKISNDEIEGILRRLGIVTHTAMRSQTDADKAQTNAEIQNLLCTIPTRRRDLQTQEDLIEEVGRIYGYDKIKPKPLMEAIKTPHKNIKRFFERQIKDIVVQNGFDEVRGYSFYSTKNAEILGLNEDKHLSLLNPMNPDQALVRQTLIGEILRACKKNISYFDDLQLFDIGKIYIPRKNKLPKERLLLTMAVVSKKTDGEQFFILKGVLENLFKHIKLADWHYDDNFKDSDKSQLAFHISRRAIIKTQRISRELGIIGEINKRATNHFGLKNYRVAIAEIDLGKLLKELKYEFMHHSLAKYPSVTRDISVIIPKKKMKVAEIQEAIFSADGKFLEDIDLFDIYVNPETGEKSMAFHMLFSHPNRTLTAEEVDKAIEKIREKLVSELDVEFKI